MEGLARGGRGLSAGRAGRGAVQGIDRIHCIGPLMRALHGALPEAKRGGWYETSADAVPHLARGLQGGDIVLAKGSLSMALAKIVDGSREMGQSGPAQENA